MAEAEATSVPPALVLMGPTASGKSALAEELAERLPLEIVSVDSAAVYRHMDVGTAKPDAAIRARIPYHLLDIIDPVDAYSAARFRADALHCMAGIAARGRLPLLCGGTMLYFRALMQGLSDLPAADPTLRAEFDRRAEREGWPALHAELARVDPATAARLEPGDAQRIQRALEVWRLTGVALSELQGRAGGAPPWRFVSAALVPAERAVLHGRIAERFDGMLAAGLVEELEDLRGRFPLGPHLPSMRCVGYRQAWAYLEGEYDRQTLREKGIAATRQLAKRQLTWIRSWRGVELFDCSERAGARRAFDYLRSAAGW